jgi:hypothetical protein
MVLHCPICKSAAHELPRTGDATGFLCAAHGNFKVVDTILVFDENYSRLEWEVALRKAKQRARGNWPLIRPADFLR